MENNKDLLSIESYGCNFEIDKRDTGEFLASIMTYDGVEVISLTKEHLKQIKDWIIENEN
jgi:hypothetical protein